MRRASIALTAVLGGRLSEMGLTLADATVMTLLLERRQLTPSGIGRLLGIHRANMTPLITRLEGRVLVERVQIDGRSQGVLLTEAGRALAVQAAEVTAAVEHEFFLGDTDVAELRTRLEALWA